MVGGVLIFWGWVEPIIVCLVYFYVVMIEISMIGGLS